MVPAWSIPVRMGRVWGHSFTWPTCGNPGLRAALGSAGTGRLDTQCCACLEQLKAGHSRHTPYGAHLIAPIDNLRPTGPNSNNFSYYVNNHHTFSQIPPGSRWLLHILTLSHLCHCNSSPQYINCDDDKDDDNDDQNPRISATPANHMIWCCTPISFITSTIHSSYTDSDRLFSILRSLGSQFIV